jgi:hypothetical protein
MWALVTPAFERDDGGSSRRLREEVMPSEALLDCAGRRRSPATLSGFHQGRRGTEGCVIHLTRRPWRRSAPLCAPLGIVPTVSGCAD